MVIRSGKQRRQSERLVQSLLGILERNFKGYRLWLTLLFLFVVATASDLVIFFPFIKYVLGLLLAVSKGVTPS